VGFAYANGGDFSVVLQYQVKCMSEQPSRNVRSAKHQRPMVRAEESNEFQRCGTPGQVIG
jgi:hypothetical protein